ncbi:unnamed protein product [Cyprideis torosa]|uniref:Uncharacterized protein n=1 Tax=Cyprideis torosa TaxID=163714 RepID=A0A7R8WFV9_9CRUS|nr:unnamed protein product [Cyprideis torosa]CAG0895834.1 unnamed protein product [Cyprideis torosa]
MMEESGVAVHSFTAALGDTRLHFYVLKLQDSFLIWVGHGSGFHDLSSAMLTRYSTTPVSTQIMGATESMVSQNIATRLSKRSGKQVFFSLNCSIQSPQIAAWAESRIVQEMEEHPEYFGLPPKLQDLANVTAELTVSSDGER